jgi:hypothetical protein
MLRYFDIQTNNFVEVETSQKETLNMSRLCGTLALVAVLMIQTGSAFAVSSSTVTSVTTKTEVAAQAIANGSLRTALSAAYASKNIAALSAIAGAFTDAESGSLQGLKSTQRVEKMMQILAGKPVAQIADAVSDFMAKAGATNNAGAIADLRIGAKSGNARPMNANDVAAAR